MPLIQGDIVIVKEILSIKQQLWGKMGVIKRYSCHNCYIVEIDEIEYVFLEGEIEKFSVGV